MEIRQLNPNDLKAFKKLRSYAVKESPQSFGESEEEITQKTDQEFLYYLEDHAKGDFVFGSFIKGELVGMAGFYREDLNNFRHKGNIWGVYLLPEYRGKGASKLMLEAVIDNARRLEGLKYIRLTVVAESTAAYELYKSLGFKVYGTELQSVCVNGVEYDEHYMQLQL